LQAIKKKYLGPSQEVRAEFNTFFAANAQAIDEEESRTGFLNLSAWEGKVNHIFEGNRVYQQLS
jgi:hypothetical protein